MHAYMSKSVPPDCACNYDHAPVGLLFLHNLHKILIKHISNIICTADIFDNHFPMSYKVKDRRRGLF